MTSKIGCPKCGQAVSGRALNAWSYAGYKVERYQCRKCSAKFNVYRGAKRTFTIPKGK